MRDLVVLSHLRWVWVWQRPQHLISRIGREVDRTWFVEEPWPCDVTSPRLGVERHGAVERVWLDVPDPGRHVGFDFPFTEHYRRQLPEVVGRPGDERIVWLYTPLAIDVALALEPTVLVYDVMDDLASFKDASPTLVRAQRRVLEAADVVFSGGRSLHEGVVCAGRDDAHLFPSGVEPEHYAGARRCRGERDRPVAGYVGVIDERLDLDLLADLAAALPDWDIRMVGPVAKIPESALPRAANLDYRGPQPYERLPEVMGGFDVALMPFAMNDATRSISPTKTLEYLAAGLPVVSTPVPDVVASFDAVVDVQPDAEGFAAACREVVGHDLSERDARLAPLLRVHHWDAIAAEMRSLVRAATPAGAFDGMTA